MDYQRIYRDFIAARKAIEHSLEGYTERHHIVPRSLGGGDEPENLVRLTAEDHFFAHLLLAKIHGRGMWVAVRRMRWGRVCGERPWVRGRYMYAIARKMCAKFVTETQSGRPGMKGSENGHFDHKIREWTNVDTSEVVKSTTSEMWERYGGSRAHWTSAVKGARKTMLGWTTMPESVAIRSNKGKQITFVNRDGRSFTGTQAEFMAFSGVNAATASRISRHKSVSRCGWRMFGVADRPHNAPIDGSRPGPNGETFTLRRGSQIVSGRRYDLALAIGVTPECIGAALTSLKNGKAMQYKGWTLHE